MNFHKHYTHRKAQAYSSCGISCCDYFTAETPPYSTAVSAAVITLQLKLLLTAQLYQLL